MKKSKETDYVEPLMLLCAFRYALGRRTYVVSYMAEKIEENLPNLSKSNIKCIMDDIEQARDLGDDMDEVVWRELHTKLFKKLQELEDDV